LPGSPAIYDLPFAEREALLRLLGRG
jgi:hypothetical protein